MTQRPGVCVVLEHSTQWWGVRTFGAAARLVKCNPGEIVSFEHMSEAEYIGRRVAL